MSRACRVERGWVECPPEHGAWRSRPGLRIGLRALRVAAAALLAAATPPASAEELEAPPAPPASPYTFHLEAGWPRGINYEIGYRTAADVDPEAPFTLGEVRLRGRVGLRLDVDGAAFVAADSLPPFDDGVEVRRARFYLAGDSRLGVPLQYRFEFSVQGSSVFLNDFYVRWRPPCVADRIDIGYLQPPMGLESVESSRSLTFMEMAAPEQALAPGYRSGITVGGHSPPWRTAWALGVYSAGQEQITGDASETVLQTVGRVAARPWLEAGTGVGDRFVHLGLSGSFVLTGRNRIRYRARPESFIAPFVVDTGDIDADRAFQYGLEGAWVSGPWTVQSELLHSTVSSSDWSPTDFLGAYGLMSWVLTGEQRPYDPAIGIFERIVPRQPFDLFGPGWGAVEIGQRISWIELSAGNVRGGDMLSLTSGVTWHLGSELKLAFNYVFAQVTENPEPGNAHIFQTRIEIGI